MKTEILRMLKSTDDYVSGQEMCDRLGVSRTAVWKVMNQMKEEGYEIEAISKKGYRILNCPDIISEAEIKSSLKTKLIGRKVRCYQELDSTNVEAKRLAEVPDTDGLIIIAEQQTAGKGRRGRTWNSPKGSGIWMSIVLKPDLEPVCASGLTLVAALAVAEAIRNTTDIDAFIKWPNDIIVADKKVCGILTEMSSELDYINQVVVGIGLNVNTKHFPEDISMVATSLYNESKKQINRSMLVVGILECFEHYYEIYLKNRNLSELMDLYNTLLINKNREVLIKEGDKELHGIALGISETGELLVRINDEIRQVVAGEVSVRGIYGYV